MAPRRGGRPAPARVLAAADRGPEDAEGAGGWLERSRLLGTVFGAAGLAVVIGAFARKGLAALDLNLVNFTFLFLGLMVHGSPAAYGRAVASGIAGITGIVVQFPFYAGILGMMKATGLIERLAHLGAGAGASFFLPATFLSAAVVNQFVPSGGAQWAVQGPIAVRTAFELGVPPERAVLAIAWGDEWTNMLQPFWALAVLGVTRLAVREILGYTALMMILTGPFYLLALLVA
jgi:short-chain fatty acids transporter